MPGFGAGWRMQCPLTMLTWCWRWRPATAAACTRRGTRRATPKPAPPRPHGFAPAIDAADFAAHVRTWPRTNSRAAPGSIGEQMTTTYLKDQFRAPRPRPGNNGSDFQRVQMVGDAACPRQRSHRHRRTHAATRARYRRGAGHEPAQGRVKVADSELGVVGYGLNAPEAGWNDYEGLDVKGKAVVT